MLEPGSTVIKKSEIKKIEYEVVSTRLIRDVQEPEPMVM